MDKPTNTFYSFGSFRIDAQKRMLSRGEEPVSLTPKAFDLLLALVENRGRVLVKDELMQKVWPDQIVEDANITVNMSALRKALGENPHEHLYIVTIPGRGYRFVADVSESDNGASGVVIEDNLQAQAAGESTAKIEKTFRARAVSLPLRSKAIAMAVLIVGLAVAGYYYFNRPSRAVALTERDTILIADFDNKTGDDVFDGALKQGLAVQLEQSPFLNIFPDERVRETLGLMGRKPDERATKEIAREICQREGLKAALVGSIAPLGSHYAIGLEAINAQTGDVFAREQAEAESKEQVIAALGKAASKIREKLGESLASIQKYDAPIERVTTSSLDALKAYSAAKERARNGNMLEAIPFCKRAIELDPNFAIAYSGLAVAYRNSGQAELAAQSSEKAFELRERVSEQEKLLVAAHYYILVVGDINKGIEAYELLRQTYPRKGGSYGALCFLYRSKGQHEKASEYGREAIRIDPRDATHTHNLVLSLEALNHFDEAAEVLDQALALNPDLPSLHGLLSGLGRLRGDTETMRQQVEWARGKQRERQALGMELTTASYLGQLRKARELGRRAIGLDEREGRKDAAAGIATEAAGRDAYAGDCRQAMKNSPAAMLNAASDPDQGFAFALAFCGEADKARPLVEGMAQKRPQDTFVNAVFAPMVRAAIELRRNNPAEAIRILEPARAYEWGTTAWVDPNYLRGLAYLRQRDGARAAAEFQGILDHRGLAASYILYPLANLGLARAAVLVGDVTKARKAYEDFFVLWKDADPDIPILQEAKREYQKLK
jgi:DNA-binding winged helix-turn-helix (wHTH) protein/tetratricopeptide (TPR) repeat protein